MEQSHTFLSQIRSGYLSPLEIPSTLRTFLSADLDEKERFAIGTEIQCFGFYLRGGTLIPQIDRVDENGTHICVPDLKRFLEGEWSYIENRLTEEEHPFLRSRYAHLLWLSKKHNKYAKAAVEGYKEVAKLYFQKVNEGERLLHNMCEVLKCYHTLSSTTRYKTEECKQELLSWLGKDDLPYLWKNTILGIITESPLFKPKDFQGLTYQLMAALKGAQYGYSAEKNYLEALLPVAQKEGVSNKEILLWLGENELALAEDRQADTTGLVPYSCYKRAAEYFKLAREKEKYVQAVQLYTAQKHKIQLGVVRVEVSDDKVQQFYKIITDLVEDLLSGHPYSPFSVLANDRSMLLPKEEHTKTSAQEQRSSVMDLFTWEVFDQNNNGRTLSEEGKKQLDWFRLYSSHLQLFALPLIEMLFFEGFKRGKITRETFLGYFNKTWLVQSLDGYSVDGEPRHFSWMELLGPALNELAKELEAHIHDKAYLPNYILPVDSLSIKLEGAIRDYAVLSGIPVTKVITGETTEMNLEELLNDEKVSALFQGDDVVLWKAVLTRKGWNTRNNTAHAFYRPEDYTKQKALLLLLCLYRLSSYDLPTKSDGNA